MRRKRCVCTERLSTRHELVYKLCNMLTSLCGGSVLLQLAEGVSQVADADQAAFRDTLGTLGPEQLCSLVRRVQQHITIEAYEEPLDTDAVRPARFRNCGVALAYRLSAMGSSG